MDKFLSSSDNHTPTSGTVASSSRSPNCTTNESPVSDMVFKTPAPGSPKKDVIDLEYENEGTSGKKKSVRKSEVWDHFTIKKGRNPGDERGVCNYCGKDYACSFRTHRTSSMLVHLRKCKKNPFRVEDKKQKLLSFGASSESGSGLLAIGYSKEACRKALAKMVIMDELPFRSVEGDGFKHFCQVMQPKFIPPSRITVARDVLQLFSKEKAKLKVSLCKDCKRVSFTTDGWTSLQNIHYMCLTTHYIDSDWKLQKRIINFCTMPNGKGETIGRLIEQCMHGWGLEKVFTVTVDNSAANDSALSYFKRRVNGWKGVVLDSEFLHQRCVAHIVNLIVNEGLKEMHSSITAIRNAVKYVKSSPARLQKFKDCVKQEKVEYKGSLVLDVPTRWNSTYMMLDVAIKFQKAFDRYEEEDEKFLGYFLEEDGGKRKVGPPMEEDWANAKVFVQFLKTFYEVTLKFSASQHVTSNTFFHEICSVQRQLNELCESSDCLLSTMAFGMRRKFEKYWGNGENINCILFIAVGLDPRYKRDYLRYCFSMVYDATTAFKLCKKVDDTLSSLMSFYGKGVDNEKNGEMAANTPKERPVQAVNELLSQFLKQRGGYMEKNDLDRYLADENVNPLTLDFDILEWWKDKSKKFKVLSQIVRDVLVVQVSTVASESAFSTGGRILDPFRSPLNPKMVEALVCTQNWLKSTHDSMQVRDYLDDLETYENLDNSTSCPTTTIEEPMSVD